MSRLTGNLGIRAAAFVIALLLCFKAETDRMVEVDCDVPITYKNLPDSLIQMGEASRAIVSSL